MRFDWKRFCERNHIEFVTSGPNTARGNISIHCPFCGAADESQHMGLKLDVRNPKWGCWRNRKHGGSDPSRLIAALLGVSQQHASQIVEQSAPPIEALDETLAMLRGSMGDEPRRAQSVRSIRPLSEFRALDATPPDAPSAYQSRFLQYLSSRGFNSDAADAARRYKLWYALTGEQAWRLVFPVYGEQHELIGWTGREVRDGAAVRYLAMPGMGKDWLLTSIRPEPADVLVICEGPVDFLKVDYYGREFGVEAVATMGTAVTTSQLVQIIKKTCTKRRTFSLFDPEAFTQSMQLASDAAGFFSRAPTFHQLPDGYEDPGAMSADDTRNLCRLLCREK